MTIQTTEERKGMEEISSIVADILLQMKQHAAVGMTTKELDQFGQALVDQYKAVSAPIAMYNFPSYTCISINDVMAHGIASDYVLKEGDLVNIDVSGEKNGFFSDNGSSFILGEDIQGLQPLVDASKEVLLESIKHIKDGVPLNDVGAIVLSEIQKRGFTVVTSLAGHGVGSSLHEQPFNIVGFPHPQITDIFRKDTTVAVEYFISNGPTLAIEDPEDGWSLRGNKKGFVAQQEHTILITENEPVILTQANGI